MSAQLYELKARIAAFEASLAAMEIKHLQGKHSQKDHGRGRGGGKGSGGGGKGSGGGGAMHYSPQQIMAKAKGMYQKSGGKSGALGKKLSTAADELVSFRRAGSVDRATAAGLDIALKVAKEDDVYLRASDSERSVLNKIAKTSGVTDSRTGPDAALRVHKSLSSDEKSTLREYGKRAMIYNEIESAVTATAAADNKQGEERRTRVKETMQALSPAINNAKLRDNQSGLVNIRRIMNEAG